MQSTVSVHLLPSLLDPAELTDTTVVVIDVLRATSTIQRHWQPGQQPSPRLLKSQQPDNKLLNLLLLYFLAANVRENVLTVLTWETLPANIDQK